LVTAVGYIYLKSNQQSILHHWLDLVIKKLFAGKSI